MDQPTHPIPRSRQAWQALALSLVQGVRPHFSPGRARVDLGGDRASSAGPLSDGMEGFSRSFLVASLAGRGAPAGGALLEPYAEGWLEGTRPGGPEAWPVQRGQAQVEAGLLALALHFSGETLWGGWDARQRRQVADWLRRLSALPVPDNNWLLFPLIIQTVLKRLDQPHDPRLIRRCLERASGHYAGDGWYRDDRGAAFDYYNAWSWHFLLPLWAWMDGPSAPAAADLVRERTALFLRTYPAFFDGQGRNIFWGRSLTYRFAAAAPFLAGLRAGCCPWPAAQVRELASRHLGSFVQPGWLGPQGHLGLGWQRPFPGVAQAYSGPASSYWAGKLFVGLLFGPEDPLWSEPGDSLPPVASPLALPAPGLCLARDPGAPQGQAQMANHGACQDLGGSRYLRLGGPLALATPDWWRRGRAALRARLRPEAVRSQWSQAGDFYGRLANGSGCLPNLGAPGPATADGRLLLLRQGEWACRSGVRPLFAGDLAAASVGRMTLASGRDWGAVRSFTLLQDGWQLRIHWLGRACENALEGGWTLAAGGLEGLSADGGPDWVGVRAAGVYSGLRRLEGYTSLHVEKNLGLNPLADASAFPCASGPAGPGRLAVLAWTAPEPSPAPALSYQPLGDGVLVQGPGFGSVYVNLGERRRPVRLDGQALEGGVLYARSWRGRLVDRR
jgi:hypothetical protein